MRTLNYANAAQFTMSITDNIRWFGKYPSGNLFFEGESFVHLLAASGYLNLIKELLSYEAIANVTTPNMKGETPLQCLLNNRTNVRDWLESARELVRLGADPSDKDESGESLLHILVGQCKTSQARETLRYIDYCICSGQYEISHYPMISKVEATIPNIEIQNKDNKSPIQCLLAQDNWDISAALSLIRMGAKLTDVNTENISVKDLLLNKDQDGKTPLQTLLDSKDWYFKDALTLLELGADPNQQNSFGQSLIHLLVERGKSDEVSNFLKKYGNTIKVDIKNSEDKTPLQLALSQNPCNEVIAYTLIEHGADPKQKDHLGQTLLHNLVAINNLTNKQTEIVNSLLTNKFFDINELNGNGETPFQYLINQINQHNMNQDKLNNLFFLLKKGANVNSQNTLGKTFLHILCSTDADISHDIETLLRYHKASDTIKDKANLTAIECGIKAFAKGAKNSTSLMALLDNCSDAFLGKCQDFFHKVEKPELDLNTLLCEAHKRKGPRSYKLQEKIKETAYKALLAAVKSCTTNESKLALLNRAKTQPIFKKHRSENFLATIGPTKSVKKINDLITTIEKDIKKQASPLSKNSRM